MQGKRRMDTDVIKLIESKHEVGSLVNRIFSNRFQLSGIYFRSLSSVVLTSFALSSMARLAHHTRGAFGRCKRSC